MCAALCRTDLIFLDGADAIFKVRNGLGYKSLVCKCQLKLLVMKLPLLGQISLMCLLFFGLGCFLTKLILAVLFGWLAGLQVCLILLRHAENELLECTSFEQILNSMKSVLPAIAARVPEVVVREALEMDIHEKLRTFEVSPRKFVAFFIIENAGDFKCYMCH